MSWVEKLFGFFGLKIEKITKRICALCDASLPEEPAKIVLNEETEIEVCSDCEKILELSNKAARGKRQVEDEEDGN
jgi:ribosome-binding protein aMBF1 (putative translation factor)